MSGDDPLETLVRSPRLKLYADHVNDLLRREQERREAWYDTMDEGVKQEFINGEVVVHSPVKSRHERASGLLYALLNLHATLRSLGRVGHEKLLVSLTRNDYEPDVCFWERAKAETFAPEQMRFPAPDFVAEVLSESTERNDRGIKFDDYAAHGVREYWIIDPETQVIEQYILEARDYVLRFRSDSGSVRSVVVQGFDIPVRAVFDDVEHLATLRRLMNG